MHVQTSSSACTLIAAASPFEGPLWLPKCLAAVSQPDSAWPATSGPGRMQRGKLYVRDRLHGEAHPITAARRTRAPRAGAEQFQTPRAHPPKLSPSTSRCGGGRESGPTAAAHSLDRAAKRPRIRARRGDTSSLRGMIQRFCVVSCRFHAAHQWERFHEPWTLSVAEWQAQAALVATPA